VNVRLEEGDENEGGDEDEGEGGYGVVVRYVR